jgi:hypothetical protein
MDLIKCEDVEWICVAQDRVVIWFCEHINEPSSSIRRVEFLDN